jgi:hypothetical protein
MENVTTTVENDVLIIRVDLTQPGKLSSTGKTKLVATSRGSARLDYGKREISFSLNVMAK